MQNRVLFHFLVSISMALPVSAIPHVISYQGMLLDSAGNPYPDGQREITFSFYRDTSGSALWTEAKTLYVSSGMVATMLGDASPLSDTLFTQPVWVGVTVDGTEIGPKVRMGGVGFAMRAGVADSAAKVASENVEGLTGLLSSKSAEDHGHDVLVAGGDTVATVSSNGKLGIGTKTPRQHLDIVKGNNSLGMIRVGNNDAENDSSKGYIGVNGGGLYLMNNTNYTGSWNADDSTRGVSAITMIDGSIRFRTAPQGSASPANRVLIDSAGRVGIGTTSPSSALDVKGIITAGQLSLGAHGKVRSSLGVNIPMNGTATINLAPYGDMDGILIVPMSGNQSGGLFAIYNEAGNSHWSSFTALSPGAWTCGGLSDPGTGAFRIWLDHENDLLRFSVTGTTFSRDAIVYYFAAF